MAIETKRCNKCGETKPRTDFSPRSKGSHLVQSWCKPCMSAYATRLAAAKVRERLGLPIDHPKMQGRRPSAPVGTVRAHDRSGYLEIKQPGHHRADRWGWVPHHIVVAEAKYGVKITRGFTVHHINGDRADNRPANLELRVGPHGKGATLLPGILRDPAARKVARRILAEYDAEGAVGASTE